MNCNSRTLRRQVGAILVALGTAVLTGTSSAQDKITIGHSQPNLGWPYIAAFTRALEAAVAEHANVELVTRSADGDIAKQANDIDSLIAVPVDFLLVTSLDGNAVIPSLMAADDAGIPILAVSNEPAEPGQALLVAYSGPDDYVQGVIAAELMHEALGGKATSSSSRARPARARRPRATRASTTGWPSSTPTSRSWPARPPTGTRSTPRRSRRTSSRSSETGSTGSSVRTTTPPPRPRRFWWLPA